MKRAWCFLAHVGLTWASIQTWMGLKKGWNWAGIELGLKEKGLGEMGRGYLQLRFWTLFDVSALIHSRMSDLCKINFFKKYTFIPFQPYMARFLIQIQEIMVNFSITDFCSVLTAQPPCSKSYFAPSRKMIKIQGKYFWKLDSYTFPTPPTSYFYHF